MKSKVLGPWDRVFGDYSLAGGDRQPSEYMVCQIGVGRGVGDRGCEQWR